ncbi:PREDICTED: heavy metal-associated isoprenylated plant protein 32 [Lupinus angustifolius]|uniref:heavy metal-associated isoprenylated plant protein 32 n=1 Tax=Lupinus angustifolius TaxID=3871 RepID=UPI00092EEB41|nr:PREDICTED: heavy metal-associated isoprenylated plant protein 32 [Lupinus angustifolius]
MPTREYEFLKIETFVLKVHMNCQGCMNKVRKVLRKIDGVYKVDIDAEEQKVIVVCRVNPTTMVQKLANLGKHAEICSVGYKEEQTYHVEEHKNMCQPQYVTSDLKGSENQYMIPTFGRDH